MSRFDTEAEEQRKKQQQQRGSWRDNTNRGFDPDALFKSIHKSVKQNSVKQGGLAQLTQQEIDDRITRQEIIQQAVKEGTYEDPKQPWNTYNRWIEDGDPSTNARLRSKNRSKSKGRGWY